MNLSLYTRSFLRKTIFGRSTSQMSLLTPIAREFRTLAQCPQLAIAEAEDDIDIRTKYRPFLLDPETEATDWISQLELDSVVTQVEENLAKTSSRLKVLVLYGSLRQRYACTYYASCTKYI